MSDDHIRYDILVQEALRGVVRKVMKEVVRSGLPGDHHFYIAFDTKASGVRISSRLREQYPDEMTVVLQHQFWDLSVTDHTFEVGLSFGGIPERLLIPFGAIKGFFDPSVQFGLQFEVDTESRAANDAESTAGDVGKPPALPAAGNDGGAETVVDGSTTEDGAKPSTAKGGKKASASKSKSAKKTKEKSEDADTSGEKPDSGAEVVSLDSFRKKT